MFCRSTVCLCRKMREDDGQPDRGLGGRHRHDEEHHDLAARAVQLGQRHEGEVDRVEHQLDAHEEHDRVPPEQHAGHAEAEQDGGEPERGPRSEASDLPLGEHDRADDGDEEQDRGDLEGHQIDLEQRRRDGAHHPARRTLLLGQLAGHEDGGGIGERGRTAPARRPAVGGVAPERDQLDRQQARRSPRVAATADGPAHVAARRGPG